MRSTFCDSMVNGSAFYCGRILCSFLLLTITVCITDEKLPSENKGFKSESSGEPQAGQQRTASGAGVPPNPFDFSAMSGLLNVLSYLCTYFNLLEYLALHVVLEVHNFVCLVQV